MCCYLTRSKANRHLTVTKIHYARQAENRRKPRTICQGNVMPTRWLDTPYYRIIPYGHWTIR